MIYAENKEAAECQKAVIKKYAANSRLFNHGEKR